MAKQKTKRRTPKRSIPHTTSRRPQRAIHARKVTTVNLRGHVHRVERDRRGRFVHWHRPYTRGKTARIVWGVRESLGRKHVDVYGTTRNSRGLKRRNRIDIIGKGQDLYNAVKMLLGSHYVPRRPYQTVSAEDLNEDPEEYLEGGMWIDSEVESL